jgi:nitrite reductase/ring-hydroxylating ferredoxin subunit
VTKLKDIKKIQPGPLVGEILKSDSGNVPQALWEESNEFLVNEDISFDRYTSKDFFDNEMEGMWSRVWQWACRLEHIPNTGDYIVYEIGPYSVFVVRTSEDEIKAYNNSCLHRGTKLKHPDSIGCSDEIICPYHGWTWNLDGSLKHIPESWDFSHVSKESYKLIEVRAEIWGGFVFINFDNNAEDLNKYLGILSEHFENWPLEDRYIALHIQKELPCNWKAALEAFIENYHSQTTHPQIIWNGGVGDSNTKYDVFSDHVTRFHAPLGIASPNIKKKLSEQEILDAMLVGDRSNVEEGVKVPKGLTARKVMADTLRSNIKKEYNVDFSHYSDSEVIDTLEYHLFPNMFLFPGLSLPMIYRFRPIGNDPDNSLFDLLFLRPIPKDKPIPDPAEPVRLSAEESYASVEGIDPDFGELYDQDTQNLRMQQEGFYAAKKNGQTLSNYQESRIRHFHFVIDKYIK